MSLCYRPLILYQRGIDPNVDDPSQCHVSEHSFGVDLLSNRLIRQDHSIVPTKDEDWPKVSDILGFQSKVRQRLFKVYDDILSGKHVLTRKIARVLFMTLEHEAFHAEVRATACIRSLHMDSHIYRLFIVDFAVHALAACRDWYDTTDRVRTPDVVYSSRLLGRGPQAIGGYCHFGTSNRHPGA